MYSGLVGEGRERFFQRHRMPEARTIEGARVRPYHEKEEPWHPGSAGIKQLDCTERGEN